MFVETLEASSTRRRSQAVAKSTMASVDAKSPDPPPTPTGNPRCLQLGDIREHLIRLEETVRQPTLAYEKALKMRHSPRACAACSARHRRHRATPVPLLPLLHSYLSPCPPLSRAPFSPPLVSSLPVSLLPVFQIIFALIERAQFARNPAIYLTGSDSQCVFGAAGAGRVDPSFTGSFMDLVRYPL